MRLPIITEWEDTHTMQPRWELQKTTGGFRSGSAEDPAIPVSLRLFDCSSSTGQNCLDVLFHIANGPETEFLDKNICDRRRQKSGKCWAQTNPFYSER